MSCNQVSKLVRYCHLVFVLFGHFDPHEYRTPWTLIGMGNYSSLEDAVDYCLILDVWHRGCAMWRKICQPSSGCISSWICFSCPRPAPCRELGLGLVVVHTATTTAAWTLCQLFCTSADTISGLRQIRLSGHKVSEGLALVLSYQRRNYLSRCVRPWILIVIY